MCARLNALKNIMIVDKKLIIKIKIRLRLLQMLYMRIILFHDFVFFITKQQKTKITEKKFDAFLDLISPK